MREAAQLGWPAAGWGDATTTLAVAGWLAAGLSSTLVVALRRRLELAARAEHELRGPLAALALAAERIRRGATGAELASMLEAQLDRSRAGLADLSAALDGRTRAPVRRQVALERLARQTAAGWRLAAASAGRRLRVDWRAGPAPVAADRGRLAQALGNVLSNAVEHGDGDIVLRGERVDGAVRVEVRSGADGGSRGGDGGSRTGTGRHPRWRWPAPVGRRGRGLAIATDALEQSGGRLELRSGEDGTTAALELPLERC